MNEKYDIAETMYCSVQIIQYMFDHIFYSFNLMLAHDLIETVRNPFMSIEKRRWMIWVCSFALVLLFIPYYLISSLLMNDSDCGSLNMRFVIKSFEAVFLMIYFTYALFACIFAAKSLFRKGMNEKMRKLIIYRQMVYQIILAATGLPYFAYTFYHLIASLI